MHNFWTPNFGRRFWPKFPLKKYQNEMHYRPMEGRFWRILVHFPESAFYQLKRPQQKAESHKAFGYWREKERGMVICQYADKFAK